MATKSGSEMDAVTTHIQTAVFNTEIAALDLSQDPENDKPEYLVITTRIEGKIEFSTNKETLSISDLNTKWTTHADGCSDCEGWSL